MLAVGMCDAARHRRAAVTFRRTMYSCFRSLDLRYLPQTTCSPGEPTEDELEETARSLHCGRPSNQSALEKRGLCALDAGLIANTHRQKGLMAKKDSSANGGSAAGSMVAGRAITSGNAGLVFEKKSSTPRSRASERAEGGMWWVGSQTSIEAADKLQAQRSQRRVLVEDGDEGSDDDKVRAAEGARWRGREGGGREGRGTDGQRDRRGRERGERAGRGRHGVPLADHDKACMERATCVKLVPLQRHDGLSLRHQMLCRLKLHPENDHKVK